MSMLGKTLSAGLLGLALMASAASATTVTEGNGNFSNVWETPTVIAPGTTQISGSGGPAFSGGDPVDVFQLSGLAPGASSVIFDFTLTPPVSANSFSNGGGSIYFSEIPFSGAFFAIAPDGSSLGSQDLLAGDFEVVFNPFDAGNPAAQGTSQLTLNLDGNFGGELFIAMNFTFGDVSYSITPPAWASTTPSAVPLPAAGWLLLAAFSALGAVSARRRVS